jgi:hypothetical protein
MKVIITIKTILQNLLRILKDTRKQINKYFKRPEIEGHYDY